MLAIATDVASWLVCTCESGTPVSRAKTVRPIEMMQFNGILVLATFWIAAVCALPKKELVSQ